MQPSTSGPAGFPSAGGKLEALMQYVSTRGGAEPVSFLDAVLAGLAPDGGLYVPQAWPKLPDGLRAGIAPYAEVAAVLLKLFAGDDLSEAEARELADAAYGPNSAFVHPAITPLSQLDCGTWLLELFHGPSLAFKDVAMQLIGPLYDFALAKRDERLTVVCATSGDTGGAAVEALKGRDRVDLFVLLPKGRVSDVQRRFMTASGAANVHALELDSDFDACQAIVKAMFADAEFAKRARLSGVNSINWARIVAQAAYFCTSAGALGGTDAVDFVVPTGNFGDAFSGWVAKRIGANVGRIHAATNANDVLVRALSSGRFDKRESLATLAPAMDIQSPSNFERVLYDVSENDSALVSGLYASLAQSGAFDLPEKLRERLSRLFDATRAADADLIAAMREARKKTGEIICPHTASAWHAARARLEPERPRVLLATAHPAKFPETVETAIGVRPALPDFCADLYQRPERFDELGADAAAVKKRIAARSRAWA